MPVSVTTGTAAARSRGTTKDHKRTVVRGGERTARVAATRAETHHLWYRPCSTRDRRCRSTPTRTCPGCAPSAARVPARCTSPCCCAGRTGSTSTGCRRRCGSRSRAVGTSGPTAAPPRTCCWRTATGSPSAGRCGPTGSSAMSAPCGRRCTRVDGRGTWWLVAWLTAGYLELGSELRGAGELAGCWC